MSWRRRFWGCGTGNGTKCNGTHSFGTLVVLSFSRKSHNQPLFKHISTTAITQSLCCQLFISHYKNKITMASPSSKTPGVPPKIPKRSSSKRTRKQLEADYALLRYQDLEARKKIKLSHSFDANYWLSAAAASDVSAKIHEVETKFAIQKWKEEDGGGNGDVMGWWSTPEAHGLIEKLRAAIYEKELYMRQAEKIQRGGPVRRAFQAMFKTSQIGLGAQKAGVGKRTKTQQSKFRQNIIRADGAAITNPRKPKVITDLYDSATGRELVPSHVTAAHIVPHSLGPDVLIALFGINVEGEIDTPYNGLLLQSDIERAMDDGAIAIVPDLPDDPSTEEVATWESTEPKEYKWRVIDDDAEVLDEKFLEGIDMTIRGLGGKRLFFKNDMRPRARCLYFLFVVAQLKLAWRHDYRNDPANVLKKQLGKGFWATKGRYLKRPFLLALAQEIGHDTQLSDNIPMEPGDDNEPDETGIIGIAKLLRFQKRRYEDEDEEDEDEEEGNN